MTPELIVAIIAFLAAGTALIKQITDMLKMRAQRAETKEARDKDSQELHDTILRHGFDIAQLKDAQALTATVVDDLRDQCAALNSNIVKLDTNVANLTEAIRELKSK